MGQNQVVRGKFSNIYKDVVGVNYIYSYHYITLAYKSIPNKDENLKEDASNITLHLKWNLESVSQGNMNISTILIFGQDMG